MSEVFIIGRKMGSKAKDISMLCAVSLALLTLVVGSNNFEPNDGQTTTTNTLEKSQPCRPRPVIKDLGRVNEALQPRNVLIYQCNGFDGSLTTRNEKCVATKRSEVIYKNIYNLDLNEQMEMSVFNDSECAMKCVCELNGHQCDEDNALERYHVNCPLKMRWDPVVCDCVEGLPGGIIPRPTDGPTSSTGVSVSVLVGALIGEFLLILFVLLLVRKNQHRCEKDVKCDAELLSR